MSDPRPLSLPRLDPLGDRNWIEPAEGAGPATAGPPAAAPPAAGGSAPPRPFVELTEQLALDGESPVPPSDQPAMSFDAHVANSNAEEEAALFGDERVVSALEQVRAEGQKQVAELSAEVQALRAQLAEQEARFAATAVQTATARAAALAGAEDQLLDLSVAVAGALVEQAVEDNPELHAQLARTALESVSGADRAVLHASPDAHAHIVGVFGGEQFEHEGVRVQVVLDPTLGGLGCLVETPSGRVDGRVAERLRMVRRTFQDAHRRRHSGEAS